MADHYFSKKPTSEFKTTEIEVRLRGNILKFTTSSGVFSIKKVDRGSEVLIENAVVNDEDLVLDLGCGYGPVGIAIKKAFPSTQVTFSDVNLRAVRLTKINLKKNHVEGEVVQGDCFENVEGEFDVILLNPPQTAGKELCFQMIVDSKNYLIEGGSLQIVARHNKGGDALSTKMKETFGNFEVLAKKSGYWVYISKKHTKK